MTDKLMTTKQAAKALGVSTDTVRRRCESGKLNARMISGVWAIDRESVRWQQRRRRLRDAIRARRA